MKKILLILLLLPLFCLGQPISYIGASMYVPYTPPAGPPSAGLLAYHEADQGATTSQWDDLSGNGRHWVQATSGSRPTYASNEYTFSGSTPSFMTMSGLTLTQPFTIYMVVKWTPTFAAYFLNDGGGAGTNVRIYAQSTDVQITANGGIDFMPSGSAPPSNTYFLIRAVFNGASAICQVNSGTPGVAPMGTGTVGTNSSTGTIAIGTNAGSFFNDDFKIEADYFYSTVTDATFKAYITTKWGIAGL